MLGVLVNTAAVLLGSLIGLLCKKGIPEKTASAAMTAIGLCSVYIGIDGAMAGSNALILILSMVFGSALGTLVDIDGKLSSLGDRIERRFRREDGRVSIAEGFVTGSLLFCVGAMTIVGSLNAGLSGDNEMLFTKSLLDLISACMLSVTLGVGVMFAAAFVFVFQGAIVLLSQLLAPILNANNAIAEITCAGSLMIIAIGLNLLGITKLKVANMLPALIFAPVFCWLFTLLPINL